jgi:hypothetical protein
MKRKKEGHVILLGTWRAAHCASLGSTSCDTAGLVTALSNAIGEPWQVEDVVYSTGNPQPGRNYGKLKTQKS